MDELESLPDFDRELEALRRRLADLLAGVPADDAALAEADRRLAIAQGVWDEAGAAVVAAMAATTQPWGTHREFGPGELEAGRDAQRAAAETREQADEALQAALVERNAVAARRGDRRGSARNCEQQIAQLEQRRARLAAQTEAERGPLERIRSRVAARLGMATAEPAGQQSPRGS